ncbi:MAG: peptide deformylase [Clostridia bacterium]|jgi:peptide deformylase|nr:peptide deformylase [Clostridia bacterium]MDH7572117.1 peptide deformylase [Clostridia bacterium]
MAVYQILRVGSDVLRQKARPVPKITPHVERLLDNLADTMYAALGVGLAAPQIGVSKRVIVVDVGEGLIELVNPEIIRREGREVGPEGCLSIPGLEGEVPRSERVVVEGWDRKGATVRVEGTGLLARALQHEIDHLDGILFTDRALRVYRIDQGPSG